MHDSNLNNMGQAFVQQSTEAATSEKRLLNTALSFIVDKIIEMDEVLQEVRVDLQRAGHYKAANKIEEKTLTAEQYEKLRMLHEKANPGSATRNKN